MQNSTIGKNQFSLPALSLSLSPLAKDTLLLYAQAKFI